MKELSKLEFLSVHGVGVTDSDLIHLQGLAHLRQLGLDSTKVTEAGVKKIQTKLPDTKISYRPGRPMTAMTEPRRRMKWSRFRCQLIDPFVDAGLGNGCIRVCSVFGEVE